jgi:hypothetical protein
LILLDTDVLLDVALDRNPHADASGALLDLLERRPRMAFVAWHTLSNFYYLVRPTKGTDVAQAFLSDLTTFATVAPAGPGGCDAGGGGQGVRRLVHRNADHQGLPELTRSCADARRPGRRIGLSPGGGS